MTGFDRRGRRNRTSDSSPWVRLDNPIQVAFAILALGMVACMIISTCLAPF